MIFFCNMGVIPPEAYTLMGVNAKVGNEPFGRFGTGLKYAIATILRNGGNIWIKTRGSEGFALHHFGTREINIRDKVFNQITVNGENLPYTAELGKDWSLESAYRELVCNCHDEGGKIFESIDDEDLVEWETVIGVDMPEITKLFKNNKMFLESEEIGRARFGSIDISFHEGASSTVYYRGVAVYKFEDRFPYTLNFRSEIALTEDRTARSHFDLLNGLSKVLPIVADPTILTRMLSSKTKTLSGLAISVPARISDVWLDTCLILHKRGKLKNDRVRQWLRDRIRTERLEVYGHFGGTSSDSYLTAIREMRDQGIDISTRMFVIDPEATELECKEHSSGRVIIIPEDRLKEASLVRTLIISAVMYQTEYEPTGGDCEALITIIERLLKNKKT